MAPEDHVLLINMHHIISDEWSIGILIRELTTLYSAYSQGEPDPLAPLPVQYAEFSAWQRHYLTSETLVKHSSYWRETLEGGPPLLALPTDRKRPAQQDYRGGFIGIEIDEVLVTALKSLSQRHKMTLFMTVLAGWAVVLSRLARQDDIVIGTATANRTHSEIEGLIGFFVNTLALRIDVSESATVAQFLEQVRNVVLGAYEHQELPFEQVVELVRPVRSLSHAPLFQAMVVWQNDDEASLEFPGIQVSSIEGSAYAAKFDLTLGLAETRGRIIGGFTYATGLFDRSTVGRYRGYLVRVLSEMVADARRSVGELDILHGEERHRLLVEWNRTTAEYPKDRCIHELIEAQVARDPDATAVIFEGQSLSYGELNARANRLAHHLRALGVVPDSRVAICENSMQDPIKSLIVLDT
jgi:non-ribosomal peptide synthetase component F